MASEKRDNQATAKQHELRSKVEEDPHANNNGQPKQEGFAGMIRNSAHPMLNLVTIGFKITAIVAFILLDLFVESEAVAYLVVILLGAMDFWVTKNISGRILVGLRWWNEVKDDGSEVWIYESKNESISYELI
jgi:hypothetical protein